MTTSEISAALLAAPAEDVATASAACKRRTLEREGIPMFVALHDARPGRSLDVSDRTGRAEGEQLARLFAHYRDGLATRPLVPGLDELAVEGDSSDAPADEPDPTGAAALIDVLVVLSDQHLRTRPEPTR